MRGERREWVVSPLDPAVREIARELDIHWALAQILFQRGLQSPELAQKFLSPSFDALKDPFSYEHMTEAVRRIRGAIQEKQKILIYGDYDVDGVTGSAILYPVLKNLGADVEAHIPHRIEEGYGLNLEVLKRLVKKKFSLVITVDNGITGVEAVRFLNENGVDTIIVDHHTPKETLPPAFAIIRGDLKEDLAACALSFKLAWALAGDLESVREYLDLVVIGTVADMAPVVGENRAILVHGLLVLRQSQRVGLKALAAVSRLPSMATISYKDIAFILAPRINASGRMGSPEHTFKLLTTTNALEAQNLAQILEDANRDRQRCESEAFAQAVEQVEADSFAASDTVLVLAHPDWHEGVIGILASRLVERYHKPAIVISFKGEVAKGSGRSAPDFALFQAIEPCEDLLVSFGGHAQACGLTIRRENIPLFRKKVNEIAQSFLAQKAAPFLPIDCELGLQDIDFKFLQDLERLGPFGPGHTRPRFLTRWIKFKKPPVKRGTNTLHAWVSDERGERMVEMIAFRMFDRWQSDDAPQLLDVVHQPTLNQFRGIRSIKLELEDFRPVSNGV